MVHKKVALSIFITAFSLLLPCVSEAADFSKVDLNAWLRIRYTRYEVGLSPLSGPVEGLSDSEVLITKGGGIFQQTTSRQNPLGSPAPFETFIMRGIATPAERARFAAAVESLRPGVQGDCISLTTDERVWDLNVIWYGRGSRRQQFRILVSRQPEESLPACSKEVADFRIALISLLADVGSHRDTEFLSTPPR